MSKSRELELLLNEARRSRKTQHDVLNSYLYQEDLIVLDTRTFIHVIQKYLA